MVINKELAKAAIKLDKVTYTSAFRYNETSKSYYREFDPTLPQYVGAPGPELDKSWRKLLVGLFCSFSFFFMH
jgi:hypothetical protein